MKQPTFGKSDARRFFYPFYREPLWGLSQQLVKRLKEIAGERGKPLAQLVLNWTIQQSGVTTAIAGARSPEQVVMNAGAGEWELSGDELSAIDKAYGRIFGGES
jgi:aryl-alcohol dehydrogenase-like predicted oxidoreductase